MLPGIDSLASFRERLLFMAAVLALAALPAARGADLRALTVERVDDRYHMKSEAWFAADRAQMYGVLTDYDLFEEFSSAFVESRNLGLDARGRPRFFMRVRGCILLFCRSVARHGHLLLESPTEIVAVTEPGQSDFRYGRERWVLEERDGGTLLIYDFEMEPAFWVPPLIGPYVIKRKLRNDGAEAIDRIEALALGRSAGK